MNTGQILDALGRGTITPTEATRLMQEADERARDAVLPRWLWRALRWLLRP